MTVSPNPSLSLTQTLARMIAVLQGTSHETWGKELARIERLVDVDQPFAQREILSLYGGMGSISDIVLYANGNLLIQETEELDQLRQHLYELCRAWAK